MKRGDEFGRQIANKADRVAQQHRVFARHCHTPERGIQGCEQLIGSKGLARRQSIKESRLARIGVTDERHRRQACTAPRPRALCALASDLIEAFGQYGDPLTD